MDSQSRAATPKGLHELLIAVRNRECSIEDAVDSLRDLPFADLGFANVDHHRELRRGIPEVVYGEGKTSAQLAAIFRALDAKGQRALATRVDPETARALVFAVEGVKYDSVARVAVLARTLPPVWGHGPIVVVAAGTCDIPVAEEAVATAHALGSEVHRLYDVGVAGLHRLLAHGEMLRGVGPIIVVAGMEGALPSVVAGLTRSPVIAVPTSVGYGAAFGGLAALLGMLNSCSSGVTVVNIDNGFGAAYAATQINRVGLRPPVQ